MATAREIRRRMTSVRSIRQITRATELIAVTRLRRAQQHVLATRPYADKMRQVLSDLVERVSPAAADGTVGTAGVGTAGVGDGIMDGQASDETGGEGAFHPLLERRPIRRVGAIVLSTDRGLCGALNANILRTATQWVYEQQNAGRPADLILVGRKGIQTMRRARLEVVAEFTDLGDYPASTRVAPITRVAMEAFIRRQVDEVVLIYPRFISTLRQEPTVVPLLPMEPPQREAEAEGTHTARTEYIYEPTPQEVLAALLPRFVEIQVYQAVLELKASEFSAKMVAMRNASDNAGELLNELQLGYNKARQATITREIIEVSAGAAADRQ